MILLHIIRCLGLDKPQQAVEQRDLLEKIETHHRKFHKLNKENRNEISKSGDVASRLINEGLLYDHATRFCQEAAKLVIKSHDFEVLNSIEATKVKQIFYANLFIDFHFHFLEVAKQMEHNLSNPLLDDATKDFSENERRRSLKEVDQCMLLSHYVLNKKLENSEAADYFFEPIEMLVREIENKLKQERFVG